MRGYGAVVAFDTQLKGLDRQVQATAAQATTLYTKYKPLIEYLQSQMMRVPAERGY